jgi:ABC-type polar amino acid transport system ATPase subunit
MVPSGHPLIGDTEKISMFPAFNLYMIQLLMNSLEISGKIRKTSQSLFGRHKQRISIARFDY